MKNIRLKICGLRDNKNIREVFDLQPDYAGFIFYPGSPRYIGHPLPEDIQPANSKDIKRVGVFVDEPLGALAMTAALYRLDMVQLHGNESPAYCANLKRRNLGIIKTFKIGKEFNFESVKPYINIVNFFLFDTPGKLHGGSGETFTWEILDAYPYTIPYFLSGGISLENVENVFRLNSPYLYAVDVNSRFEITAGLKDLEKLRKLKDKLIHLNQSKL